MNKELIKKYAPYLVAILLFLIITFSYCYPILEGKVLNQGDMISHGGMAKESIDFHDKNGDFPWWTNSMFSGMPAYQIASATNSSAIISSIGNFLRIIPYGNIPALGLLIGYLIGAFILLHSFNINKWLCIVGAIAISFSSYFFIILAAGHITKMISIAFVLPIIAGFILIFRKKYMWGICLTMIYTAVGFTPHPQMSYYFFMMLGIFCFAEIYIHIKEKRYKDLIVSLVIFCAAFTIGFGTSFYKVWSNMEYVKETMRGGHSELVKEDGEETLSKSSGLSLDYATQWSYGIDETMTLLIPNFMGGSSHYPLGTDSDIYKEMIKNGVSQNSAAPFCQSLPMYWGTQPFTSGPVYIGAIVCFLFVLGLFIVKGPYKWAILAATFFSIILSWGHNFMWFTELFFNYFPMYSKFRAVSSILVVAEITMPLLGFLAIKAIMDKDIEKKQLLKSIRYSAQITAGVCLFFILFGKMMFSFSSPADAQMFSQLPEWLSSAIIAERARMLQSDAFRSFIFIALGVGVLWMFVKGKMTFKYFVISLGLLICFDMWPVNKRFFGADSFVDKKQKANNFVMQAYEKQILQDKDPHFRVLNVTTNTFNESRTSYYLKSVGGYHAAKLRRYQDLIDAHISKNNINVLNMLNTKYFIVPGKNGQATPQLNQSAMGNAWFIDTLQLVNTPNEESNALNYINISTTAVTDKKFESQATLLNTPIDSTAIISLTKYEPNLLEYKSNSSIDKTAVFSEVYYPHGWDAYIDNKPVDHFRVNYVLRALNIPAGEHEIRFEFKPDSIYIGEKISMAFIVLMFGIVLFCIVYSIIKQRKQINQ